MCGDRRDQPVDERRANLIRDVLPAENDAGTVIAGMGRLECQFEFIKHFAHVGFVTEASAKVISKQRGRAIHRAGVEVGIAESRRQHARSRRFAGAGRSIDGDDWATLLHECVQTEVRAAK